MEETRVSVVGVGNGGIRIVDCLAGAGKPGVGTAAVNTDARSLAASRATTKIQIGATLTRDLGAAGNAHTGRVAAQNDLQMIRNLFADMDLAFVVAGLGGGTGSGAAPVLLEAARDAGVMTLCFATLPFEFEGAQKREIADEAVEELRAVSDALIVVPNDRLFETAGGAGLPEGFEKADRILAAAARSVWRLVTQPGLITLDFADLQRIAQQSGSLTMGFGEGRGKNRAARAVEAVLQGPLLDEGRIVASARALLVSIVGGEDLALKEVGEIMDAVKAAAGAEADVFMGTVVDAECRSRITVTVIASEQWAAGPRAKKKGDAEPAGAKGGRRPQQIQLGFDAGGKGRFRDTEPTILNGEDLDTPTFIRRSITIER